MKIFFCNKTFFPFQSLVKTRAHLVPDGLMVIQGSLGESKYTVGSAVFPTMNIDQNGVFNVFRKAGFTLLKWEISQKVTTHYFALIQMIN